jgi:hypothetical protein
MIDLFTLRSTDLFLRLCSSNLRKYPQKQGTLDNIDTRHDMQNVLNIELLKSATVV